MVENILMRQERCGGYRFDRDTGKITFLEKFDDEVAQMRRDGDRFDYVGVPLGASLIALTAPLAVWHETTRACNLNCLPCGKAQVHEAELDLSRIKEVYKDLAESGVFELRVTGGEACVRQDIEDVVRAANDAGLYVSLTSNGVYGEVLRERVSALPIGLYIISLEGTREVNDAIRGKGTYDSAMRTIKTLARKGRNVRVNMVLMKDNQSCLEAFAGELVDAGVSALTLIPLRPAGNAAAAFYEHKLTPREYMGVVERVNRLRAERPGFSISTNYDILSADTHISNVPSHWSKMCIAGIEGACISPAGSLRACILAAGQGMDAGSLTKERFMDVWHDDNRWGVFRDPDKRVLDQCRSCKDYTKKCPGSCLAMTQFSKSPEEIYCFKQLI